MSSILFSMLYYMRMNYLPRNITIATAGASWGTYVIEMSRLWPESTIHAFEPNPRVYDGLNQNLQMANLSNTVKTYNFALGAKNEMADFYVDARNTSYASSLFHPLKVDGFLEKPIQVPVLTLDTWSEINQVSQVDFLFLDMQGAEGHMLQASPNILKTVKVIELEFFTSPVYEGTMLLDEIKPFLENLGFKTLYLEPETNGEIIFVRK